jgi:GNAT superfamily N-acetyltransferase
MLDVLAREWADGSMRFAAPGEALFAARDERGLLLGIGGITCDPHATDALRMRRFYVAPAARGAGVGRCLAATAIGHAGAACIRLRAPATAFTFWERLGFRPVAGDVQATHELNPPGRAPPAP